MISRETILVLLAVVAPLYVLLVAIYRLFFHPLARYPGPILAKLSSLYMISAASQCKDTYTRYDLHQKFGKVVRTGPNELCFADSASIKDIYGQSAEPCLKAPQFYNGFTLTGLHSVFSAQERSSHARMRRLLSHGFSERGVLSCQQELEQTIRTYLDAISSKAGPVELHDLTHALFLDTISQLSFGKSFNILTRGEHPGALDIETYFTISPLFGHFPAARYLPFGPFQAARAARPRIITSVQADIQDFRQRLQRGTTQSGLLKLMVEAKDAETGTSFSDAELIENAVLFIIAGSGTTASTLLYLIYEVSKRANAQQRLETEIRGVFPNMDVFPDFEAANKLPYLNCILQEVLRLRGPIPTVAPRVSPGKVIGGAYVPAGTIVSNLAYTTQRDSEVFPEPLRFMPERWENNATTTPAMKLMHRPFSTGPRNCIGMHLARVQLLLTVCALYQRFDLRVDGCMTDEMMKMRDQGVMTVGGRKLWVHATART